MPVIELRVFSRAPKHKASVMEPIASMLHAFGLWQYHTEVMVDGHQYTWLLKQEGHETTLDPDCIETIQIPYTSINANVSQILTDMAGGWTREQYNTLTHSCNHFTQELIQRILKDKNYRHPGWVFRSQRLGAFISLTPRNKIGGAHYGFPSTRTLMFLFAQMLFVTAQCAVALGAIYTQSDSAILKYSTVIMTSIGAALTVAIAVLEAQSVSFDKLVTPVASFKVLSNLCYYVSCILLTSSMLSGSITKARLIFISVACCIALAYQLLFVVTIMIVFGDWLVP